jgi:hypothetical protein
MQNIYDVQREKRGDDRVRQEPLRGIHQNIGGDKNNRHIEKPVAKRPANNTHIQ